MVKSEGKAVNKFSACCGNSFKTVGKAFQVKLVERMPRVWKAVKQGKGWLLEESKMFNIF
jgi:hypothetical protein